MAFSELQTYNDTRQFRNKHPLLIHYSLRNEYEKLISDNPDKFLEEYANCRDNVKRYSSYLNNKKRSKELKENDEKNLQKHQLREMLFKEILSGHVSE